MIGDIHGAHKALMQCLERSKFNFEQDKLICLGDVCDGWPETKKCVDELLTIKNLVYILGNHDLWTLEWAKGDIDRIDTNWIANGGRSTIVSYEYRKPPKEHIEFFQNAYDESLIYQKNNTVFVHAGIDYEYPENSSMFTLLWDREFVRKVFSFSRTDEPLTRFKRIFVGHTPTLSHIIRGDDKPMKLGEVWALDTGAGWHGKLTIMDVDTEEYWQSDLVPILYPGVKGRGQ